MSKKTIGILCMLAVVAGVLASYTWADPPEREEREREMRERGERERGDRERGDRPPMRRPGEMRPGMPAPGGPGREYIERFGMMLGLIERMKHVAFEPETAAMIAIGGIKDEVKRPQEELIKDLEDVLGKTKTLGLRNAIRMSLKDLYKARGENDKVVAHLKGMLAENDAAIQAEIQRHRQRRDRDQD